MVNQVSKEAVLRTLVPIVYALLIKAGVGDWLGLDDEFLQSVAALVGAGLIYVLLRVGEAHQEWLGWLLGYAAQPSYHQPVYHTDVLNQVTTGDVDPVPPPPGSPGLHPHPSVPPTTPFPPQSTGPSTDPPTDPPTTEPPRLPPE